MHAAVPYSSQQAGGAQSRAIPYRSRQFGIGSSHGYAAFEWLGSTWCLRGWSQQPPGITPIPATQPLSKRPLSGHSRHRNILVANGQEWTLLNFCASWLGRECLKSGYFTAYYRLSAMPLPMYGALFG